MGYFWGANIPNVLPVLKCGPPLLRVAHKPDYPLMRVLRALGGNRGDNHPRSTRLSDAFAGFCHDICDHFFAMTMLLIGCLLTLCAISLTQRLVDERGNFVPVALVFKRRTQHHQHVLDQNRRRKRALLDDIDQFVTDAITCCSPVGRAQEFRAHGRHRNLALFLIVTCLDKSLDQASHHHRFIDRQFE